jgi:hypothetical protein
MDEGPKQIGPTSWALSDYGNGAKIGYRNAVANIEFGYQYDDPSAEQNTLYGVPASEQDLWGEADYQLAHGRTDIGVTYVGYTGFHQTLWDPYAVNCLPTTAQTYQKVLASNGTTVTVPTTTTTPAGTQTTKGNFGPPVTIPYTKNGVYTAGACQAAATALGSSFLNGGGGYVPIVYGQSGGAAPPSGPNAGLPITGAYVSNGAGAQYPNIDVLGLFLVENLGKLRIAVEGTDKFGNDPYTLTRWQSPYSVFFQADYGAGAVAVPGVKGKNDFEIGGFQVGFNALDEAMAYYQGPAIWTQFTTDPAGYQMAWVGVKHYLTDTAEVGLFGAHLGLIPGQIIPAGSATCPGCAITGDSRNGLWGELIFSF